MLFDETIWPPIIKLNTSFNKYTLSKVSLDLMKAYFSVNTVSKRFNNRICLSIFLKERNQNIYKFMIVGKMITILPPHYNYIVEDENLS